MAETPGFFSREAGLARRRALDEYLNEAADYYLGPTGIPDRLRAVNEFFNPVAAMEDASTAAVRASNPDLPAAERLGAAGESALNVALFGIPGALSARGYIPTVEAATEMLTGIGAASPLVQEAARATLERLNQPGPMPTLYSNPLPGTRVPEGAKVKPRMGEAFDDWIDRIYAPENRGPGNVVQDENVVFRAMSPEEVHAGEAAGVFRDLSGQPLYVANDPERYIGGGAYGGKGRGRIYEFDVTGVPSEVRQGGVGIQERAVSEIPTDRIRRVWEWNPDTKAHELLVDNTRPQR